MKKNEEKNYSWFKFYPADWRAGTARLTGPQAAIHLNFILYCLDGHADHLEIVRGGGDLAADILADSSFLSRIGGRIGNNPTSRKNFEAVLLGAWTADAAAPDGKRWFRCPMLSQVAAARTGIDESRKGAGKAIAAAAAARPPKPFPRERHHVSDHKNLSPEERAMFTDLRSELEGGIV